MLSEAEKAWLKARASESCAVCKSPIFYCAVCSRKEPHGLLEADMFSFSGMRICPTENEYKEATEFDDRVNACMKKPSAGAWECEGKEACLKHARLAVEKEFDETL